MVKTPKNPNPQVVQDIATTLSDSMVCGKQLRDAHYRLGCYLGSFIESEFTTPKRKILIIPLMRSGLMFGLGIADRLEQQHEVVVRFVHSEDETINTSPFDNIILVDGVINTGNTVKRYLQKLSGKDVFVATNVISHSAVSLFEQDNVYAVRVSEHSFKGANVKRRDDVLGPDTSERLFDSGYFRERDEAETSGVEGVKECR